MTAPWMPPLPEGGPARFRCESCEGSGRDGHMMYQGEFQPPEDGPCPDCDGRGWHLEKNAVDADQMRQAQADAARAALEQAARWVRNRSDAYDAEHGTTDPETGAREYPGTGDEYMMELAEIEDGIRELAKEIT